MWCWVRVCDLDKRPCHYKHRTLWYHVHFLLRCDSCNVGLPWRNLANCFKWYSSADVLFCCRTTPSARWTSSVVLVAMTMAASLYQSRSLLAHSEHSSPDKMPLSVWRAFNTESWERGGELMSQQKTLHTRALSYLYVQSDLPLKNVRNPSMDKGAVPPPCQPFNQVLFQFQVQVQIARYGSNTHAGLTTIKFRLNVVHNFAISNWISPLCVGISVI